MKIISKDAKRTRDYFAAVEEDGLLTQLALLVDVDHDMIYTGTNGADYCIL